MAGEFTAWLRSLGHDGLTEVLTLRPDAASAPSPDSLADLASRLTQRQSVFRALSELNEPGLQLAEVLAAGSTMTRAELAQWLDEGRAVSTETVEALLSELRRRALCWEPAETSDAPESGRLPMRTDRGRVIRPVGGLSGVWSHPLGLGERLRPLLGRLQPGQITAVLRALQLRPGGSRAQIHGRIEADLTPDRIRALAAAAPAEAHELLEHALHAGPYVAVPEDQAYRVYSPGRYGRSSGYEWALEHALLLPASWDVMEMPREVAAALRGEEWHPELTVDRPHVATTAVRREAVERESGAAAAALLDLVGSVAESLATAPAAELRTGGVGVREVRRIAKTVARTEMEVLLALELAGHARLVGIEQEHVLPTEGYDEWRAAAPAEQLARLLSIWWSSPVPFMQRTDLATGKPLPALGFGPPREDVRQLRQALLAATASLSPDQGVVDPVALLAAVRWDRPLSYPTDIDRDAQGRAAWAEAEALGLIAHGAATDIGRALAGGDDAALVAAAGRVLPAAAVNATFQADLTAVVAGTPGTELLELLDSAADREARGSASVWRFSPTSVRRFLDAGGIIDQLVKQLEAVSTRKLPQPLVYLLNDVGRRHGHVAVQPVTCCVVSDDTALVAEVAASRALAVLGLRVLAPTVLASGKPVPETLERLRAAGYAPVRLSASGDPVIERAPRRRIGKAPTRPGSASRVAGPPHRLARAVSPGAKKGRAGEPAAVDPAALARTLIEEHDAPSAPAPASLTLVRLRELAVRLSPAEQAVLAHAVDTGDSVHIEYVDVNGKYTDRVVSDLDVMPPFLLGWCHLRQDERMFSLANIESAAPA